MSETADWRAWFPGAEKASLLLIAGPCVVEDYDTCARVAEALQQACAREGFSYVFKASYRKANRTRGISFQGIGDEAALNILAQVRQNVGVPVLTDVHETIEVPAAAQVVDVLQIPAFLARQTTLLQAAGRTGKIVNIKKGQFMSPEAALFAAEKVSMTGNRQIFLTERGTFFGYSDLVVDFRSVPRMRAGGIRFYWMPRMPCSSPTLAPARPWAKELSCPSMRIWAWSLALTASSWKCIQSRRLPQ